LATIAACCASENDPALTLSDELPVNSTADDSSSSTLPPDTVTLLLPDAVNAPDEYNEPPLTVIDDWSTSDSIVLDPRSTFPPLTEIDAVVACTRA